MELKLIQKESIGLSEHIENLEINHKEDMLKATELLSNLNKYNDALIEELEKVTIPLKKALKAEEARFKPLQTLYKGAITTLRTKMGEYQSRAIQERLDAEKAIADRIKSGKGGLKVETAIKKIGELDAVDRKVEGDAGSVTFMAKDDFEVMDVTMLPHEFILPNEVKIRAAMKAGQKLPGVRYFTSQVVRNLR